MKERELIMNYNVLVPMIPITCAVIDSSYPVNDNPETVTIHIPFDQMRNVVNAFNDAFDAVNEAKLNEKDWKLLGSAGYFDVFGQKTYSNDVMFEFGFEMEMMQDWDYSWRMKYDDAVSLVKYLEKIAF